MEKGRGMAAGDSGRDKRRDDLLDGIGCRELEEDYCVRKEK